MKVDVDCKERIKIALTFLLQSYKVLMGSMVLLFVPRGCDDHICSVTDNLYNTNDLNVSGLVFNFITVCSFVAVYAAELRRENWCVHNFDIDHNISDNNLAIILKNKPELSNTLHYHNRLYKNTTLGCLTIFIVNFVISNYILYNDEVFWTIGLAPYSSYMILVLMKIYNSYYIATHSIINDKALSAYMTEFSSFNIIDPDMLTLEDKRQNSIEEKNEVIEPLPFMIPNPLPDVVV
tara:strand:+ start:26 stop:733 length:708 start_codon:yes stop_codon:yes gene_type:complete